MEAAGSVDKEEETENVVACLHNLTIETAGTEEEAAEGLEASLGLEMDGYGEEGGEGEEKGAGNQGALGALELLTQYKEPSGTTLIDACNGFNEPSRLTMLWIVRHLWPAGARFAFN